MKIDSFDCRRKSVIDFFVNLERKVLTVRVLSITLSAFDNLIIFSDLFLLAFFVEKGDSGEFVVIRDVLL